MKAMNKIKELRKAKKMYQSDLAKELNVSQSMVSYWESGTYEIDHETLKSLADYFGVSIDYLLGYTAQPNDSDKPKDLIEFLDRETVALNGRLMTEEDKEKMKTILEMLYWDSTEKNKRKK